MAPKPEEDFPKGHPGRFDYDPTSPEAIEWARHNVAPLGERDFPVDHPKAADTPGNLNTLVWTTGVDPFNPHREAHTGRSPVQAAGVAALSETASKAAVESPVLKPVDAAAVNVALAAKRQELGRDVLTAEEYSAVMATFHTAAGVEEVDEETKAKIELQHRALAVMLDRGYTRSTALEIIAREGAEKILAASADK